MSFALICVYSISFITLFGCLVAIDYMIYRKLVDSIVSFLVGAIFIGISIFVLDSMFFMMIEKMFNDNLDSMFFMMIEKMFNGNF